MIHGIFKAAEYFREQYSVLHKRVPTYTGNRVTAKAKYEGDPGVIAIELVDMDYVNSLQIVEPCYFWVINRSYDYPGWRQDSGLSYDGTLGFTFDVRIHDACKARNNTIVYLIEVLKNGTITEFKYNDIMAFVDRHDTIKQNPRFPDQTDVGIPISIGKLFE